ncbi:ABC transporter substrate binding protein [Pseudomonas sp. HK3]
MSHILKIIMFLSIMLSPLLALGSTVGLVVDAPSEQISAFKQQLDAQLPTDNIQVISVSQLSALDESSVDKWLTLGPNALNKLLSEFKALKGPVLALFLPESARIKISEEYSQPFTTLENAPDMLKQLSLIHALVPQAKQVGVFYSSQFKVDKAKLDQAAKRIGLNLHWAELKDPLDWDRHALKILADVDLVLGVNDDALYNTTTIRSILMRLYRSSKALIGPDKGYVRAGAVASTYSGIEETLLAASSWIRGDLATTSVLNNPYFNVSVNAQVARSLNIMADDTDSLIQKIKERTDER